MLFLDFCNIKTWNLEIISALYEKYKIVHSKDGEIRGWENHCETKHDKRWFYFSTQNIPQDWKEKTPYFFVSPDESKFRDLWKFLKKSQSEYRSFLEKCIKHKLDLEFINKKLNRLSGTASLNKNPIHFLENPENKWKPKITYNVPYLPDIESYLEWEIISLNLYPERQPLLKRVRRCKFRKCQKYFLYNRPKQNFCRTKCRLALHYDEDMATGKRQEQHEEWVKKNLNILNK